jgi:hypothetical protein
MGFFLAVPVPAYFCVKKIADGNVEEENVEDRH